MNNITICYIAGREATYSRTAIVYKALHQAGFQIIGLFPPDKRFSHYPKLMWQFLWKQKACDLIVVGFYGQLLMLVVRLLTRKPVLYDIYISTFDTMVYDRGNTTPQSFMAGLYRTVDRLSMLWADRILLETADHITDYSNKFKVPEKKFKQLFLAVDDEVIAPVPAVQPSDYFLVHFHGEYAPFHGVRTILKAAHLLKGEAVRFEIVGTGITYDEDMKLVRRYELDHVKFIDWVPYNELALSMSRAHCCLGIFGDNPRTFRVLTNKVVEALAVARPLITVRNNPVQELVQDRESALLIPPADPDALAAAILWLRDHPAQAKKIGDRGYHQFKTHCTLSGFSDRLKTIINQMLAGGV
jgi:glycosyltransferase involved in cell wall biosynthesis